MKSDFECQPIALVIPWFGKLLKGGAEQQAWQIATRLASHGHKVEVLTTCCRSFSDDWAENHLPKGESLEEGITVRRFLVDARDRVSFDSLNRELLAKAPGSFLPGVAPVSSETASIWTSGNINSSELEAYIKTHAEKYQNFIFIPYLYGVVLRALPLVASRAWLQPCLHDEAYAYLPDVAAIFQAATGLLFNSHGEMQLAARLFGPIALSKGHVVGEGIELDFDESTSDVADLPIGIHGLRFMLCLGRRCKEKGTDTLVEAFIKFRHRNPRFDMRLVLAGPGDSTYANIKEGIIDVGLVSEAQKIALLKACLGLLQPSLNESFSRVLFEAWTFGKPAVVHKDCLATACAVESSKGGWTAGSEEEWVSRLTYLSSCAEDELRDVGAHGNKFARELANWDLVMARYEQLLDLNVRKRTKATLSNQRMGAIHQLLPNLSYGDAISNHAIWIREQLLLRGYRSEIFVRYIHQLVRDKCRVYQPGAFDAGDGLLYHHSIGSEVTPVACLHPGPKWLIYHNITPPEFFQPYRTEHARLLRHGREEMWTLARAFPSSVGVSNYNAEELQMYGFASPRVLPLAIDPGSWNVSPDEEIMKRLQDGRRNLLYVGRYAPNKCQHDLIEAFAHYSRLDPESRLILVGNGDSEDPYVKFIHESIDRHSVRQRVILAGHVSLAELHAYYRTAHLFWSMSEHEGFCVPLVEAMWFDLPILAFQAGAVGETLGPAGIKFDQKMDLAVIAAIAAKMTGERAAIEPVLREQRNRRNAFSPHAVAEALFQMVA
jgi:glycosyltransferase involved in cell wall biosynthesis